VAVKQALPAARCRAVAEQFLGNLVPFAAAN
jgi:hypothetical protein